jgi:aminoglycoside 6-adenylyltransferase
MRSEQEMLQLIIKTAQEDGRIRAAYLGGSRVNQDAPKDIFQDYDVVYVVTETSSFRDDRHWIDRFGRRLYMQYPEDSPFYPSDAENCYGWLMQFSDGVRLDLHVDTLQYALNDLKAEPLYNILLDKDRCLPEPPGSAEAHYCIKKPTQAEFRCTCNEFWWCLNNVAKGLWREELPYVMDMLNLHVRPMLLRLLSWKTGRDTGFSVSAGKSGKYLYRWLAPEIWERYLTTYPRADVNEIWASVFIMCDLADETSDEVAAQLGFEYDCQEAYESRRYLQHVRQLLKGVKEIF